MHVTIAGGGPGGLFAALVLAGDGHDVVVVEQNQMPADSGAGIQISPNGTRLLAHAGVLEEIRRLAFEPQAAVLRRACSGRTVFMAPLGRAAEERYGAPYLHLHRADLARVLTDAVRSRGIDLLSGARISNCEAGGDHAARVSIENGTEIGSDLLIGADGIHSTIRSDLFGPSEARFTKQIAWRGLVPTNRVRANAITPEVTVWAGPGCHFVHYYVRGGELINFVAILERDTWVDENWHVPGDPDEVRRCFSDWDPGISSLLEAADTCHLWGLFDRPPLEQWGRGRTTLLGDACHPMLPFMAQGAVMAFEDAAVLGQALRMYDDDVPSAIAVYEAVRKPRTAQVQERSRRNGRLFHQRSAIARTLTDVSVALVSRSVPAVIAGQLDWLYSYDAATVDLPRIA